MRFRRWLGQAIVDVGLWVTSIGAWIRPIAPVKGSPADRPFSALEPTRCPYGVKVGESIKRCHDPKGHRGNHKAAHGPYYVNWQGDFPSQFDTILAPHPSRG